ncbi:DUF2742 domain-containing protein [Mycobacterium sp. SM1]|uniref:DUF2742 domain-containing protein n=1 Tax=Mycobacterium sp. SM1 TaxID=2816243 RepID=UPI001BD009F6|nr:DUF2742 domain-containing protein [Mycobacterium sp. SM1]MBS4730060.1 DUF2742 domain-containing protein [Mycobacterium sp. SM1]
MTETIIVTLRGDRSEIDDTNLVERGRQLVLSRRHAPAPAGDDGPSTTPRSPQHVSLQSRQVSWWPVHVYVDRLLTRAGYGELPWPGTPAWCALSDNDPRKLLALAEFGQHHALRVETAQQDMAEASKAVAASADWRAIANEITQLHAAVASGIRIPRKAS